jgi:hypothetical protein
MNGFTGPILASITALTRLVALYAPPPPCGLPADSGLWMGTLAQAPPRQPLLRQRAADDLCADRAHGAVRLNTSAGLPPMRRMPRCATA